MTIGSTVHRIEVRSRSGSPDPRGEAVCREAQTLGLSQSPALMESARVYFIQGDLTNDQLHRVADELLADPITEQAEIGASQVEADAIIEVHPLPGVMDPDAQAIHTALSAILTTKTRVRTGWRYDIHGTDTDTARRIAERCLANPVIHDIHTTPYLPQQFPTGSPYHLRDHIIALRDMDDAALEKLSREAHLFLNLEEMQAIRAEYQRLQRDPRDIELETLAQTWSEHCVHKTLKATIRYNPPTPPHSPTHDPPSETNECFTSSMGGGIDFSSRPGHELHDDGSVTIHNLFKSTIAAATDELIADGIDWCLSVFKDNAGVITFDDQQAVCFKVETHNHPSALEPYGGAATGIGGVIRDIIGTGLAAQPIASTDIFCVAYPDHWSRNHDDQAESTGDSSQRPLPAGCLHPRRILSQVVAGVRDYGNRMGIPTVNGSVWFDDRYIGNPLVYCGTVGVIPRDKVTGDPNPGDRIIALGGRTGRDGIHGATFSSAELTDTHVDEFSHAVQIGNPVTEKMMLDAILQMRDHPDGCLYTAITDCGAGGFSSAVGEMGEALGAEVHLEQAPLKYDGLSPTEIWISEAQERMVIAVPPDYVQRVLDICAAHDVEVWELGHFGTENSELILHYHDTEVGRLSMDFLFNGLPGTMREATWRADSISATETPEQQPAPNTKEALLRLLAHPNIASKRWIIRQYDHEVQGQSVIKPLVGPDGEGPGDAAVMLPVDRSTKGLSIAHGLTTGLQEDPYVMTLAAIDECVRNLVCVGTDPTRIALLDNFCWPSCADPESLGSLVRAAEACYDGAKAFRTPFISGKDSLNNQFATEDGETITIPPTLLISGMGIVPDIQRCISMDAKRAGNLLVLLGQTTSAMRGSHYQMMFGSAGASVLPVVDLTLGNQLARTMYELICSGYILSAHDCSEGGMLVAAAEMCIAGNLGLSLQSFDTQACFAETPSRYLLEIAPDQLDHFRRIVNDLPWLEIGRFNDSDRLTMDHGDLDVTVDKLRASWLGTLNW